MSPGALGLQRPLGVTPVEAGVSWLSHWEPQGRVMTLGQAGPCGWGKFLGGGPSCELSAAPAQGLLRVGLGVLRPHPAPSVCHRLHVMG